MAFYDAAFQAEIERSDRRFKIAACSAVGLFLALTVALVWLAVTSEPKRRAAFVAECQSHGFSEAQCRFLYRERVARDADETASLAIAVGVATTGAALMRR